MSAPTFLKIWSALTRGLLVLALLLWLLFGVSLAALHWWIVPRINDFRPQLQAQASQVLGVPVRIGALVARSDGLMAALELRQVELFDAHGQVVLSLPRVQASVSARSLWRLGFEQLYIDQPQLDIQRNSAGQISIAGFAVANQGPANQGALDWLFSQRELTVHQAKLRWRDALHYGAPVLLTEVNASLRNSGRQHQLRLEATPPQQWGARFSLQGQLLAPLLAQHNGRWQDWSGQLFASFERLDLSGWRSLFDPGIELPDALGALRAWGQIERGQLAGATVDLALAQLALKLAPDLPTLALQNVQSRLTAQRINGGFALEAQALQFDTQPGQHWPRSNVKLSLAKPQAGNAPSGQLQLDRVDLALLTQIMASLPLPANWHQKIANYAPRGQLQQFDLGWHGAFEAPTAYQIKGQLRQLQLAAVGQQPGLSGLDADFALDQNSGSAKLMMSHGSINAVGLFQEPSINVDQLAAQAAWRFDGQQLALEVSQAKFSNADAQGQAKFKWHSGAPGSLGVLDLQASLQHAKGNRVYRYLPLVIPAQARNYVRDAVREANASKVQFDIRGALDDLPATQPKQGVFKISADISQARMSYLPKSLQSSAEKPWPQLTDLSGKLLIDGLSLQVKDAHARLGASQTLQATNIQVNIDNLEQTRVQASFELTGSLAEALQVIKQSALAELSSHALGQTLATGNASLKLKLDLPIANIRQSRLQGSVALANNTIQLTPSSPKLSQTNGIVEFNQAGFSLTGVQAQALGGSVKLSGGLLLDASAIGAAQHPSSLHINGSASAQGLRQATQLGWLAQLAQNFSGTSNYSATLGWRHNALELLVNSDLQGLTSTWPAPLQKAAASRLPLRYQSQMLIDASTKKPSERISLSLADVAQVSYDVDLSQPKAQPQRGWLRLGRATPNTAEPTFGVVAQIALPQLDVDAWLSALQELSAPSSSAVAFDLAPWLPQRIALRTPLLGLGQRHFKQVQMEAWREAALWRAKVQSDELAGYLQYHPVNPATAGDHGGALYARLSKLHLASVAPSQLERWADAQPSVLPALDLVVDDFEWSGKALGRLEVTAINQLSASASASASANPSARKNEWQLKQLKLINPSATLSASGSWALLAAKSNDQPSAGKAQRCTALDFKLHINDAGALLTRLGLHDLIRRGSGSIEGHLAWIGAPLELDYPSLSGAFGIKLDAGQFLQADPGAAKLLGVLSLQALPRRLTLDFRDVFSQGFMFDLVRGDVTLKHGMAHTNNLKMTGVNAAVLMQGWADIAKQTQDLQVIVVPEINAGTASLIAATINPAVGLGSLLAQWLLRRPLMKANTRQFHIDGTWADPRITPASAASAAGAPNQPSTP